MRKSGEVTVPVCNFSQGVYIFIKYDIMKLHSDIKSFLNERCSEKNKRAQYALLLPYLFRGTAFFSEVKTMETRVAVISIIVEKIESAALLNDILHEYGKYIIGRMGIPYRDKNISVISVAVDAPQDVINTLSGKIGKLDGVNSKAAYSNVITKL